MRLVRPLDRPRFFPTAAAALVATLALAAGCDRPPSADGLKEWTPADHDRAEEQARIQSGQQAAPDPKGDAPAGSSRPNALIEVAWQQNCASCHGPMGHGDGPSGPMVKASDLTREEWQAKVTDDEMIALIRTGKGSMPKFDLPEPVVRGLVARIRALRGR
jgi:mono/diheme cytochrome c family protein